LKNFDAVFESLVCDFMHTFLTLTMYISKYEWILWEGQSVYTIITLPHI